MPNATATFNTCTSAHVLHCHSPELFTQLKLLKGLHHCLPPCLRWMMKMGWTLSAVNVFQSDLTIMSFLQVFAEQASQAYYSSSVLFKEQLNPKIYFFLLKTNVFRDKVALLIDSGPTPNVLVKVFQFGVFCGKNVCFEIL